MSTPDNSSPFLADLHTIMEKQASAVATIQGNQGQLTVAVNRLQSDKPVPATADASTLATTDTSANAAKFGHKLLFPTYDDLEDSLPWLNRYDQFFHVQETPAMGKAF
jgi:hypothetical protein